MAEVEWQAARSDADDYVNSKGSPLALVDASSLEKR